jgi:pyruvyltransferase
VLKDSLKKILPLRPGEILKYLREDTVSMYWSNSRETRNNFGDAINPSLCSFLLKRRACNSKSSINFKNKDVLFMVGSILDNLNEPNAVVCGAGFKSEKSKIFSKPKKIISVRGPLTKNVFDSHGVECPASYCDPGVFVSDMYPVGNEKRWRCGVLPHYVDKKYVLSKNFLERNPDVLFVDVLGEPHDICKKIAECELLVSSSLHGIIAAHALGVPAVWAKFSDKIVGGDFKFRDYYLGASSDVPEQLRKDLDKCTFSDLRAMSTLVDTLRSKSSWIEAMRLNGYLNT